MGGTDRDESWRGRDECQVVLEEPVAVDAYVAVIMKWSSLQVYQMQHEFCCKCAHF